MSISFRKATIITLSGLREGNFYWKKYKLELKTDQEKLDDLAQAIKDSRLDIVKLLIEEGGVGVNTVSEREQKCQGLTPLHVAARHNKIECLRYLISIGADVNCIDNFGFRPIHDAAMLGHCECLEELLANGATIDGGSKYGQERLTPLYYATQQNHKQCVEVLLNQSNVCDKFFWEMSSKRENLSIFDMKENKEEVSGTFFEDYLFNSAINGNLRFLKTFKDHVSRNLNSKEALRSVMGSTIHDKVTYLETLLEGGLDPNMVDSQHNTALHYAARFGHQECIMLLIKYGAKLDAKNNQNWTPLHLAIRHGCLEGLNTLLENGGNINEIGGSDDDTPLGIALKIPAQEDIFRRLLEGRPDLTIRNKKGELATEIKCDVAYFNELIIEYVRN